MTFLHRAILLACLLVAAGCSYTLTMTPPPEELRVELDHRPDLLLRVQSTYAPYVDGHLDYEDLYARDGQIGSFDQYQYRMAFGATQRFETVQDGDAGTGLHCLVEFVSGRQPVSGWQILGSLLTIGIVRPQLAEIIELRATMSAPGRTPKTYAITANVCSNGMQRNDTMLRRVKYDPEREIVDALVTRIANDGWLDR